MNVLFWLNNIKCKIGTALHGLTLPENKEDRLSQENSKVDTIPLKREFKDRLENKINMYQKQDDLTEFELIINDLKERPLRIKSTSDEFDRLVYYEEKRESTNELKQMFISYDDESIRQKIKTISEKDEETEFDVLYRNGRIERLTRTKFKNKVLRGEESLHERLATNQRMRKQYSEMSFGFVDIDIDEMDELVVKMEVKCCALLDSETGVACIGSKKIYNGIPQIMEYFINEKNKVIIIYDRLGKEKYEIRQNLAKQKEMIYDCDGNFLGSGDIGSYEYGQYEEFHDFLMDRSKVKEKTIKYDKEKR